MPRLLSIGVLHVLWFDAARYQPLSNQWWWIVFKILCLELSHCLRERALDGPAIGRVSYLVRTFATSLGLYYPKT